MKSFLFILLIASSFISCERDWYKGTPESVQGYALLSVDTGQSILSTFFYDSLDRRDSFASCFNDPVIGKLGFDTLQIVDYRGVQLVKGDVKLFIQVIGASRIVATNDSTMDVLTTIGTSRIVFNQNQIPEMKNYVLDRRLVFPDRMPCFAPSQDFRSVNSNFTGYIECPVNDGKLKYGWTKKLIQNPKCKF